MRPSNKIRAKATPSDCSTRASVWDAGSSLACLVVCCAGVTLGKGRRRFATAARRRCTHVIAPGVAILTKHTVHTAYVRIRRQQLLKSP
jgi:hypothetical protein